MHNQNFNLNIMTLGNTSWRSGQDLGKLYDNVTPNPTGWISSNSNNSKNHVCLIAIGWNCSLLTNTFDCGWLQFLTHNSIICALRLKKTTNFVVKLRSLSGPYFLESIKTRVVGVSKNISKLKKRDACSTADILIHFHSLSSIVIHSHPLSFTLVRFHPLFSSISIHFWPLSLIFIHFHPLSLTSIDFDPLLTTFIDFHPISSTFIHFHWLWSNFIHFWPLSLIFNQFHPFPTLFIHFHPGGLPWSVSER